MSHVRTVVAQGRERRDATSLMVSVQEQILERQREKEGEAGEAVTRASSRGKSAGRVLDYSTVGVLAEGNSWCWSCSEATPQA